MPRETLHTTREEIGHWIPRTHERMVVKRCVMEQQHKKLGIVMFIRKKRIRVCFVILAAILPVMFLARELGVISHAYAIPSYETPESVLPVTEEKTFLTPLCVETWLRVKASTVGLTLDDQWLLLMSLLFSKGSSEDKIAEMGIKAIKDGAVDNPDMDFGDAYYHALGNYYMMTGKTAVADSTKKFLLTHFEETFGDSLETQLRGFQMKDNVEGFEPFAASKIRLELLYLRKGLENGDIDPSFASAIAFSIETVGLEFLSSESSYAIIEEAKTEFDKVVNTKTSQRPAIRTHDR